MLDLANAGQICVPAVNHPVFIVKQNGAHRPVVIKGENRPGGDAETAKAYARVDFSGGLMDQIVLPNSHSMTRMNDAQVDSFLALRQDQFDATPEQWNYYKKFQDGRDDVKRIFMWFAMPFLADLEDLDQCSKNVFKQRRLAKYLNERPEILEDLGRLIAADFLIGNNDRFNYDGSIQNLGNIFFLRNGHEFDVVGIDYFDPNLGNPGSGANMKAFAALVSNEDLQRDLAQNVVTNLNSEISKSLGKDFSDGFEIPIMAWNYIYLGFKEGMRDASNYTRNYDGQKADWIIARANSALATIGEPPEIPYRRRVRQQANAGGNNAM